ncbi:hypothetical protein [Streptomyces fungicidicus]|uniref:hypothetical protein n=1 Tax=Streptomyces fungicidicus TaxID=68203 RepID=UPI0037FD6157
MNLSFWSVDAYRRSWEGALRKLEGSEKEISCLHAVRAVAAVGRPAPADGLYGVPSQASRARLWMKSRESAGTSAQVDM